MVSYKNIIKMALEAIYDRYLQFAIGLHTLSTRDIFACVVQERPRNSTHTLRYEH